MIINQFMFLLYIIDEGVSNKEINKIKLKIREDGVINGVDISYIKPIRWKNEFDVEKLYNDMENVKWKVALYNVNNKLIKEDKDYI